MMWKYVKVHSRGATEKWFDSMDNHCSCLIFIPSHAWQPVVTHHTWTTALVQYVLQYVNSQTHTWYLLICEKYLSTVYCIYIQTDLFVSLKYSLLYTYIYIPSYGLLLWARFCLLAPRSCPTRTFALYKLIVLFHNFNIVRWSVVRHALNSRDFPQHFRRGRTWDSKC